METKERFFFNNCGLWTPQIQHQILSRFKSIKEFLKNEDQAKEMVGIKPFESFLKSVERMEKEKAFEKIIASGVRIILLESEEYPAPLRFAELPPLLLYMRGHLSQDSSFGMSVIGTRRPSLYGRQQAVRFATHLSGEGFSIISGIARGIDSIALKSALENHAYVVGILGHGIDLVYPPENKSLFKDIENRGILVSEFPLGAKPLKHHFPWRNRLISAWGLGVLVVEATRKSGTAGTVRWALDQGKEVFAIPGPIDRETSRGCHAMIRDGAHLVEDPEDIVEFFSELISKRTTPSFGQMDPSNGSGLGLSFQPQSFESLLNKSGLAEIEFSKSLNLEILKGNAKRMPGNFFALCNKN